MDDTIFISALTLHTHIGVPTAERAAPQRLTVSLRLIPIRGLANLDDDLSNTVDYATVSQAVRDEAATKPRRLIETLAEDLATLLLGHFPLKAVEIELRKYVLDGAEYAAVCIRRERSFTQ
jgi:dihydroneopterin aldolase